MEFVELRPGTPEKSRRERRETKVKTDKKSLMSTQKNLVSPAHHESYQVDARSPDRGPASRTIFKEYAHTPSQDEQQRRTPSLARIQKSTNSTGGDLRHAKTVPAPVTTNDQPTKSSQAIQARPPPIKSEVAFINMQRNSATQNHERGERVLRVDCFDKSFDSRRASHRRQGSMLSSRQPTVTESIAEEPESKRPNKESVVRAAQDKPEKSEKYMDTHSDFNMVSGRNSISNLEADPNEEPKRAGALREGSLLPRPNPEPSQKAAPSQRN